MALFTKFNLIEKEFKDLGLRIKNEDLFYDGYYHFVKLDFEFFLLDGDGKTNFFEDSITFRSGFNVKQQLDKYFKRIFQPSVYREECPI